MTAGVLPGRRPRRGLPQAVEAGLDPGRRDGRVLDRDLDRPAVRRPAGDLRLEVHQHALRAGRHDRRPGRPDGAVDHGLHLPPAGAGLPAFDTRAAFGIYSAEERARQLETGSYQAEESDEEVEEELEALAQSAPVTESPRPSRLRSRPETFPRRRPAAKAAPGGAHSSAELLEVITGKASDAPLCMTCGTKMRPAGSCYVCEGCGSTSGCS